jgi:hypothetical protein
MRKALFFSTAALFVASCSLIFDSDKLKGTGIAGSDGGSDASAGADDLGGGPRPDLLGLDLSGVDLTTGGGSDGGVLKTVSFAKTASSPNLIGLGPYFIASGDFDGDGRLDLVTVNNTDNNVSVLFGAGDGTFASSVDLAIGGPAGCDGYAITTAKLNADNLTDFAVTCTDQANINGGFVYFGAATRIFATPTAIPALSATTQIQPQFIAAGDFNHDGKQDLAVSNYALNKVWVLPGKGDGTFLAQIVLTTGTAPGWIAAGDLNHDGADDLVVLNQNVGTMTVFLQAGGVLPATGATFPCHSGPAAVVMGRFTADAEIDVAVSGTSNAIVTLLSGDGTGKFPTTAPTSRATGNFPYAMASADFNRDGLADVVTANAFDDDCSLLLSDGSNLFGSATSLPCGVAAGAVVTGDFNGDGLPDIAAADRSTPNAGVTVLLNTSH